jgi:hypothetical protein
MRRYFFLLPLVLVLALAACDTTANPDSPNPLSANPLVGTWAWEEGDSFQQFVFTDTHYTLTFKDIILDSQNIPTAFSEEYSGAYIKNDATIVFYNLGAYTGDIAVMDYFINGDKLILYNRTRDMLWDLIKQ